MYGVFDAKMFTQLGYLSRIMSFLLILKFLWSLKIRYFANLKNGYSIDKNILNSLSCNSLYIRVWGYS